MLKARKKLSHKEIKKDKLVTSYFQAKDWVDVPENRKKLFTGVIIIAVIIFAVVYYFSSKNAKNEEALSKLTAVENLYQMGKFNEAINGDQSAGITGLNEIAANYSGTEAGEEAKFFLANSLFFVKDFDNALKYYDDYSGNIDLIKASCISGKGAVYEAKGDLKKAAENYEKAASMKKDLMINPENLYYAIRAYSQLGDKESAKRLFTLLKTDYPKSKFISEAKRYEPDFKN
jgi:tetratricopeptide (TPR) repeat protein